MNKQKIKETLIKILVEDFSVKSSILENFNADQDVFTLLNFKPIDLVYLLFEVEKNFNISICENDIERFGFLTINGIINIILSKS